MNPNANIHDNLSTHTDIHNNHNIHDMSCHVMSCHDHDHDHSYTEPGVFRYPSAQQLAEIRELYWIVTGRALNQITAGILEAFFEQVEPALICEALQRTGKYARRPCAQYAAAILRNWLKDGIRTIDELTAADSRHREARSHQQAMQGGWWQHDYQQHSYTEADFGPDFYYDPAKDYDKN